MTKNFDKLEILSYEVIRVGDSELSPKEEKVLKMHPKFSTMDTLQEGALDFEQELSYTKLRIQMHRELGEKLEDTEEDKKETQMTPEEQEYMEEQEA